MMMMLVHHSLQHLLGEAVILLHSGKNLRAGEIIPRGSDDAGLFIVLAQQGDRCLKFLLRHLLRTAKQDGAGILDLIEEELAEVLDIHAALHRVRNGDKAAHLHIGHILLHALDGADDVGKLAHAGRLDENAVGMILIDHLAQRLAEIAHEGAADAAGVHLGHLDAGLLHEAAVDTDLAKLIFNQDDLLACERLFEQLLDQRGLARAEEAGENINLRHIINLLYRKNNKCKKQLEYRIPTVYCTSLFVIIQGFTGKSQYASPQRTGFLSQRRYLSEISSTKTSGFSSQTCCAS